MYDTAGYFLCAMATPSRHDAGGEGNIFGDELRTSSAFEGRGGPSPSPAKARRVQRRFRSLYHQAAKEYQGWCQREEDAQRALGSVFHLLDRLRMLETDQQQEGNDNLGGLGHLPDCRTLLICKHTMELERVMRLWRALVQRMKGRVSRVEECLVEAWQLHHTEAPKAQPSSPSPPPPPPRSLGRQLHPSTQLGTLPRPVAFGSSPAASVRTRSGPDGVGLRESPSPAGVEGEGRTVWRGAGSAQMTGLAATGGGGEGAVAAVGPAEYLQWLGDMSSMLVHEQWRKDELLSRVDFCPDSSSARMRAHVEGHWSSRSKESFLDRALLDAALEAGQVVRAPPGALSI